MRRRGGAGLLFVIVLAGCGSSGDTPPSNRSVEDQAVGAAADSMLAVPVSREDLLGRLQAAGYQPGMRETPRFTSDMDRGLASVAEPPLSHFLLSLDDEAMVAFEFATVDLAKHMARTQADGFRFRNWFFGGAITVDLTREMQKALGGE